MSDIYRNPFNLIFAFFPSLSSPLVFSSFIFFLHFLVLRMDTWNTPELALPKMPLKSDLLLLLIHGLQYLKSHQFILFWRKKVLITEAYGRVKKTMKSSSSLPSIGNGAKQPSSDKSLWWLLFLWLSASDWPRISTMMVVWHRFFRYLWKMLLFQFEEKLIYKL